MLRSVSYKKRDARQSHCEINQFSGCPVNFYFSGELLSGKRLLDLLVARLKGVEEGFLGYTVVMQHGIE